MKRIGENSPKSDAKAVRKPKPSGAAEPPNAEAEPLAAEAKKAATKTDSKMAVASGQREQALKAQAAEKWVSALTSAKPPVRPRYPTGARDSKAFPKPAPATRASVDSDERKSTAPPNGAKEKSAPETERLDSAAKKTRLDTKARIEPGGTGPAPARRSKQQEASPAVAAVVEQASFAPPAVQPASNAAAPAPKVETPAPPPPAGGLGAFGPYGMPDVEALATNFARVFEHSAKAFAAFMRPRETGEIRAALADDVGEMIRSLGHVAEYYMSEPQRALEAQTALTTQFINLWAATWQRFQGAPAAPVAEPDRSDKRFSDAEWRDNPYFDFIKQAYVLTTRWADDLVRRADELDPHQRDKAQFYLRQVTAALSPSNFIGTNPELLRQTLQESGENLVRGLKMMAEDIEAGKGNLRIRQSDARAFKLGVNLAVTPGKVIFRNELIELIQYEPTTAEVFKRPLLIVPPWINKFYILDLNPEKSFIRWAVAEGLTVFVISWINPDERHADKGFEAYMREGILTALDAVEQATGERQVASIGYCVGGTLLAATLAYMAAVGDDRITSATFFAAQIDFTDPGDLKVFVDAEQLKSVEEKMAEHGYLEGSAMANAFNMLRPNDLIWSYYVNNYLKGNEPMPFDLLVWNSDSTRMPAANHKFYLRHCYLQNDLSNGRMELGGQILDLEKVTIPIYELATREDHIAPARSVFTGAKCFGGPVRYVMAGSGHIAGVVNPPYKPKYQFWSDGPPEGDFESWVAAAKQTPGSWWPDWIAWLAAQAPEKVAARPPGEGALKALGDAPGDYVRAKA